MTFDWQSISHYENKSVSCPLYLYNGNPYVQPGKVVFMLKWGSDCPVDSLHKWLVMQSFGDFFVVRMINLLNKGQYQM